MTGLIDTILIGPRFIQTEHSRESPFSEVTPIQNLLAAVWRSVTYIATDIVMYWVW